MKMKEAISEMSLQEKIAFCTGADFWHTKALPQYDIPAIMMSDGPHGLRCQKGEADMIGVNKSLPATCFPTAVTAGATWNRELYAAEGEAIGQEALAAGVPVVLGPGCNIKRNPLGGRNFEYISEDPYQAGKMAAAFIRGQQSTGAASSLKHFAANSQEYKRQNGDSQMDERTLREIYLAAFEIAVREGRPDTVMCAYNKINGVHCSDSKALLTDILRTEWGFEGMVVTDWDALNDRIRGFQAGCDLNMPGGSRFMERSAMEAAKNGILSEKDIDASVERILRLVEKAQQAKPSPVDWDAHHALAQMIAEQSAVLLKNEDGILPLSSGKMVLIGHMAKEMRYQGSGSSHINPTRLVNLTDAIRRCGKFTPLRHHLPLKGRAKKYVVNYGQSYGEWAEPADVFPNDWKNTVLPHPEESTAYTSFVMGHMAEITDYLGRPEDKALFAKYRDGCKEAYRQLIQLPGYTLDTDRQAKLVRPLAMNLLDEEQTAYAKERLVKAMENYGWRLGTGFLSTPFILDVLAEMDIEYAYRLLENEEMPGWLFMPKNGATTIWESWEGTKAQGGIASLNHYSKGAVCQWLFQTMCGIQVDGENHFTIAPRPGGHFTHAKASYRSVYGLVESGWEKNGESYTLTVNIPCNTTADLILPDGTSERIQQGSHQFTWEAGHGAK